MPRVFLSEKHMSIVDWLIREKKCFLMDLPQLQVYQFTKFLIILMFGS